MKKDIDKKVIEEIKSLLKKKRRVLRMNAGIRAVKENAS